MTYADVHRALTPAEHACLIGEAKTEPLAAICLDVLDWVGGMEAFRAIAAAFKTKPGSIVIRVPTPEGYTRLVLVRDDQCRINPLWAGLPVFTGAELVAMGTSDVAQAALAAKGIFGGGRVLPPKEAP